MLLDFENKKENYMLLSISYKFYWNYERSSFYFFVKNKNSDNFLKVQEKVQRI